MENAPGATNRARPCYAHAQPEPWLTPWLGLGSVRCRKHLAEPTYFGYPEKVAKSIRDIPKKRGRPKTTGRGSGILVRMHGDLAGRVDNWAAAQEDSPSRPEAIRRLVELGLQSKPREK